MLAAKHFDPVMGVDIHILTIPPVGPVPIPHPHISMVLDPMDYVPVLGGTVFVGGLPRGTAGTAGQPVPHIPMGGPFVKPPGNEDEIFMGSATVLADGAPFTFTALPSLSCQDVGMPAPIRPKKPKKSYGMLLPTSVVITVPAGMPVLVGGPPTIDMMGVAMAGGMAALGKAAKKVRGAMKKSKRIKKMSDAIHKKAKKIMDKLGVPPNVQNKVHKGICSVTGHPVDVASGKMFTEHVDFELPGPIPFVWERTWYSTSVYEGPLGHGWHHKYDLKLMEEDRAVAVIMEDGRACAFPALKIGEESFDRSERLTLIRDELGYALDNIEGFRHRFSNKKHTGNIQVLSELIDKPSGSKIQFFYDHQGLLEHIIDSAGRSLYFESRADGLLEKILLPEPNDNQRYFCAIQYEYRQNDLTAAIDAHDQKSQYRYQDHLMIQETNRSGLNFYFEYDKNDHTAKCIRTWGDEGIYNHKLKYDTANNITLVTNSLGHKTTYYHNGALPTKIINKRGHPSSYSYNEFSQLISKIDELGNTTSYQYDEKGNITQITHPDNSTEAFEYDGNNNPICVTDVTGAQWSWAYSKSGTVSCRIDPLDRKTSFTYSGPKLTNLVTTGGQQIEFDYDSQYNLCAARLENGYQMNWRYDELGRLIHFSDSRNNHKSIRYDLLNRVVFIREADGTEKHFTYDEEGNVTHYKDQQYEISFAFKGMGRMVSRSQNGTSIYFEYDTEERLTSIKNEFGNLYRFELDPMGEIDREIGFDGATREYQKNRRGKITQIVRPGGKSTHLQYDSMGRVLKIEHNDGFCESFQYRADGQLIEASNNFIRVNFELDPIGNIIKEIQGSHYVSSEYDQSYNRIKLESSLGAKQNIRRNGCGHALEIDMGSGAQTEFTRDELGFELARTLPGGIEQRWHRDGLGRPIEQHLNKHNIRIYSKSFQWGFNGRLEKIIDALNRQTVFQHDSVGTLTGVRYPDTETITRLPDSLGNLFKSKSQKDREYGPAGQLLSAKSTDGTTYYHYDEEGNLIEKLEPSDKRWSYRWNGAGYLTTVINPQGDAIEFQYDATGRRTQKTSPHQTTHWVWDRDNPLHEISTPPASTSHPNNPLITWHFEPDSFTPMAKQVGDKIYSIITDYLGTPALMLDDNGEKVWSMELDIWGKIHDMEGHRSDCPFRWPGQYEDEETGLYYNRFRYFDPDSGQYISQDPIRVLGDLGLYQYVSDPNTLIDFFGLSTVYLRNNEQYVGKAKVDAKTRYGKKNYATDIFTDIPDTNVAQGVEQITYERMKALESEGVLDNVTNTNRPVNMDDKNKVWRREKGEAWLKEKYGDNYKAEIDKKIKAHYNCG